MTPHVFLITFTTYGSWLHGDPRGSHRRDFGYQPPNERLMAFRRSMLAHPAVVLDVRARTVVLDAIITTCRVRGWTLEAAHVRTEHVHVVVGAADAAEKVMASLKAWATRRLREAGLVARDAPVWSEHGSTVPLRSRDACERAAAYVYEQQGEAMARYPQ